jgi:hypothetical protein
MEKRGVLWTSNVVNHERTSERERWTRHAKSQTESHRRKQEMKMWAGSEIAREECLIFLVMLRWNEESAILWYNIDFRRAKIKIPQETLGDRIFFCHSKCCTLIFVKDVSRTEVLASKQKFQMFVFNWFALKGISSHSHLHVRNSHIFSPILGRFDLLIHKRMDGNEGEGKRLSFPFPSDGDR